ncbi:MAG: hypothetical protein KGH85_05230 [Thaumarchaeota archaeon]|nr:hypothetical protein [Nitrososphaerota archaeon]
MISTKNIVEGDLKIVDVSRKNRNIKIIRKEGTSFFLKQPNISDESDSITIKREALFYTKTQLENDFLQLKNFVPRIMDFDEDKNIMVTELLNGLSLNEYNYFISKGIIRYEDAADLGRIFATLHSISVDKTHDSRLNFLPRYAPSFLIVVRPNPELFKTISPAGFQLLRLIQEYSALQDSLEELYSAWNPLTIVHGDIKWDNVICVEDSNFKETTTNKSEQSQSRVDQPSFSMVITDWETVSIGDPAWDIGGIFHEFIRYWLSSVLSYSAGKTIEQIITNTSFPIQNIQLAIRSFWFTYLKNIGLNNREKSDDLLIRSTKFCAARLVQTAYEFLYSSNTFSNIVIYMVQIAFNIFNDVEKAIIHLFGIPFRDIKWSNE